NRTDSTLNAAHHVVESAFSQGRSGPDLHELTQSVAGDFIEIRSPTGRILSSGGVPRFPGDALPPPPQLPGTISLPRVGRSPDRVRYFSVPANTGGLRYRIRASLDPGENVILIVGTPLGEVDSTLHRLLLIELLVTLFVLAAIALLGLWIVRLGLRPLGAIGRTADAIAAGDLSRRVERAEERTEVGRLGLALNSMLGQIEAAFQARAASEARLRRFVADASHELRTPLAGIRAYAELFGRGANQRPDDLARSMRGIERESERMGVLVEDLLLLARLDEGRPLEREPVRLSEVVTEAVETARAVEPARPIELTVEPVVVLGDRDRLRQILDNLLSNVRSHTPAGTPAHVSLGTSNGTAVLEVRDEGPGLSAEDELRVFERFYRADASRSRELGGVGLGLSIVAAVTEAHDGSVTAGATPGEGTTFRITLPLASEADADPTARRLPAS
ncbi:MAG: sensor histidine kinase, partial [Gaiellaceae bacterium]